jgi:hypothetical protein
MLEYAKGLLMRIADLQQQVSGKQTNLFKTQAILDNLKS